MPDYFNAKGYGQYLCSYIADLYPGVIVICDDKGRVLWVNQRFENLTGYSLEEVEGMPPGKILQGPETDQKTVKFIKESMCKQREFCCEILNYRKDGTNYWIELSAVPVIVDGELKFWLGTKHRIDEQLQKILKEEKILKDTLEELRKVLYSKNAV